jgi:hypothetical protein
VTQPTFQCKLCGHDLDPRDVCELLEVTTTAWREITLQAGDGKPVIAPSSAGRPQDLGSSGDVTADSFGFQCAWCSKSTMRLEELVRLVDGQPPSSLDQLTITPEGGPTT